MKYETERLVASTGCFICFGMAVILALLNFAYFIPSGLLVGLGIVLFMKGILDVPFPWELRRRYPGGGD